MGQRVIHLTQVVPPPRPIGLRAGEARRVASTVARRLRGAAAGSGARDHLAVVERLGHHGLFEQAVEEQAAASRGAAVEAERELVEVGVEVLGADGALVGAQEPALEQLRDSVHGRHRDVGGVLTG